MATNKHISVLGRITATTYEELTSAGPPPVYTVVNEITASTSRLEIGMTIIFLSSVGGLTAGTQYYIISDGFTSTKFKVSASLGGSEVTLTDSSVTVSYIAYREFSSTIPTPSLIIDSVSSVITVDYSDNYDRLTSAIESINSATERLGDAFQTSDSTKFADNFQQIVNLASGDGIRTLPAYSWYLAASSYKIYVDDAGGIGLSAFTNYKSRLESIPKY